MRFSPKKQPRKMMTELEMASMIDVVFLLLIFFMCTASFARPENDMDISSTVPGVSDQQQEFETIRVRLFQIEDGCGIQCDATACENMAMLTDELKKRRQYANAPVIIEGDAAVSFEPMIQALNAAKKVGFTQVAFSLGGAP